MCVDILMYVDEITTSNTPEINAMKAEFYKLKCSLDSALHLQDFLCSTDMANSLMTDTENLYTQATQLYGQVQEKRHQLTRYVYIYTYVRTSGNIYSVVFLLYEILWNIP